MAFCKYCGKQIPEGGACDCDEAKAERLSAQESGPETEQPAESAAPAENEPEAKTVTEEKAEDAGEKKEKKEKKEKSGGSSKSGIIAAIITVVAVVVIVVVIIAVAAGSGYKEPIEDLEKALNKSDGDRIMRICMTDDYYDKYGKDKSEAFDGFLDAVTDAIGKADGGDVSFKFRVKDKDRLDKDDLREIESYYSSVLDEKVDIRKGYDVEVSVKLKTKKQKSERDIDIEVIKIDGEGWKISAKSFDYSSDLFDSLDLSGDSGLFSQFGSYGSGSQLPTASPFDPDDYDDRHDSFDDRF